MKKSLLSIIVLFFCFYIVKSQTVDEILSNYYKSIGGLDKLKNHNTTKAFGKTPTPQGEFSFVYYQKRPNKVKIVVDIMGKQLIPQAYDGETAWMLNPFMGDAAQKLPADMAKQIISEAEIEDPLIDYATKGHEVTFEGIEEIQGVQCLKLKLIKHKGNKENESIQYYFLDKTSYLPIMVKSTVKMGDQPAQETETYFSDYQEVGNGMIIPFSIETKVSGQVINNLIFTKVLINEEIPDEEFKFPGGTN
jgi:outer membrane lipoprotein-sorting protein